MKLGIFSVCLLGTISIYQFAISPAIAQISSDGTLSTTITTDDAINFLIENGDRTGDNLFHSFSEFSIPNLGEAYFNNATDIVNIFSRVTGGNISDIQGLIRANGTANLFLINPAGIIFGENASLDIGGSFFATTAESVVFGDGREFSAIEPEEAPILTINITPGLQMGSNSGSITVQENGHAITGGGFFPIIFNNTATGLQVNQGETLGLIGKEINLTGGIIRVPGGNIQLSSIEEGILNLDNSSQSWQFDTTQVQSFGDINLLAKSLLDTSGVFTGDIQLQGRNITLEDASTVLIQNLGTQTSGNITVNATETIQISGSLRNAPDQLTPLGNIVGVVLSRLITENLGVGKAGDIIVSSGNLLLKGGGLITTRNYSEANTSTIDVNINQLFESDGFSTLSPNFASGITTVNFSTGGFGGINISAQNMNLSNGSTVSASTFGSGQGAEIQISIAEEFTLSGFNPEMVLPTVVGSTAFRTGNSGNVTINTSKLSLLNGSSLNTSTLAEGFAGKLTINASESINISGEKPELGLISRISSSGVVASEIFRQSVGLPDLPSGDSGSIFINTSSLMVTDSGSLSVENGGLGNSGNLQINANDILINTGGRITAFSASGQGGNIELNTEDSLLLRNGSFITAEATGNLDNNQSVDGGNITINSDLVTLLEGSQINANALEGNGGNITITTQGLFVSPDSNITASSQFGVDGVVTINNPEADESAALLELPKNTTDPSQQIAEGCAWVRNNSFIVTGRGGTPKNPTNILVNDQMWSDIREISENQPLVTRKQLLVNQSPLIEANTWIINEQGNVELVAVVNPQDIQNHFLTAHCAG